MNFENIKISLRKLWWIILIFTIMFGILGFLVEKKVKTPAKISFAISVSGERVENPEEYSYDDFYIASAAAAKTQSIAVFLKSGSAGNLVISNSETEDLCSAKEKFFKTESFETAASLTGTFSCNGSITEEDLTKIRDSMQEILGNEFENQWDEKVVDWKISVTEMQNVSVKIPNYLVTALFGISGVFFGTFVILVFGTTEK